MSRDIINLGTGPNSGNGDPLRTAFQKVEHNFDELYAHANSTNNPHNLTPTQIGAVAASILGQPGGVATLDGMGRLRYAQRPSYTYEDFTTGAVQIDLIPALSATSLGNSTNRWQAAFIGSLTVNTVTTADVVITNSVTTSVPLVSNASTVITHESSDIARVVGTSLVLGHGNTAAASNSTIVSAREGVILSSDNGGYTLSWSNGSLTTDALTIITSTIQLVANTTIANSLVVTNTTATFLGSPIWTSGNFDPALKLDASQYTAADILTKIKTVDGSGSGLDAALLGGLVPSFYSDWNNLNNKPTTIEGYGISDAAAASDIVPSAILAGLLTIDGAGSGLDADFLDGQHSSFYLSWDNQLDKPNTIDGYGIIDAQPIDSTLTALAALSGVGIVVSETQDTFEYRAIGIANATDILTRAAADTRYITTAGTHVFTDLNTFENGVVVQNGLTIENPLTASYETTLWMKNPLSASLDDPILVSPSIRHTASAWNTLAGASRGFDFFNEIIPTSGDEASLQWRYSYHGAEPETLLELRSDGSLLVSNAVVWTTGNMGIGSGLNSDLLDGQHGAYYLAWENLTGRPTTLSGYEITDAQPLNSKLTGFTQVSGIGFLAQTNSATYETRILQGDGTVEITNANGETGDVTISVGPVLDGLSSLSEDAGAIVSLGGNTFSTLPIGAGSSSSLLDRSSGDTRYIQKTGGTFTGSVTLDADPTSPLHAATKQYVDNAVEGITAKVAVRVASTANVSLSTPGASIDGVTLASGDRILLKNQSTASQNGVYVFTDDSTALVRATDINEMEEFPGAFVFVESGTQNALTGWLCTSDIGTLETSDIEFVQFSAAAVGYTTGIGLSLTANEFAVTGSLAALHQFTSNGIMVHNAGTFQARTITGPAAGITVTNGSGLAGNPTIALADDLAAIEALSSNGFAVRTGISTWTTRTLAVGTGLSITNQDGLMTNPTISLGTNLQNLNATSWVSGVQIPVLTAADTWALRTIGSSSGYILDRAAGDALFVKLAEANTLLGTLMLRAGNSVAAPLSFQAGALLTSPSAHALEWDGTDLYITNDANARKRLVYSDSSISGSAASATIADRWSTARTLVITGDVESSMSVDGSINVLSNATIQNGVVTNTKLANASANTIKGAVSAGSPVDLTPTQAKTILSLENVENKSSTTIRGELTSLNVTTALAYTPANLAGDTFTGTVVLRAGTTSNAPLRFQAGTINTSPVPHSVEWNGNVMYVTNSASSRHEVQFRDDSLNWSRIVSTPTTLSGYGITDAASSNAADVLASVLAIDGDGSGIDADLLDGHHGAYYLDWDNITNRSTTLAGYGITDAQPLDTGLTALAAANWTSGSQIPVFTAANTVTMTTVGSSSGNILNKAAGDALYLGIAATAANAVLLNGQAASYYTTADNLTGTVPVGTLPTNVQKFSLLTPATDATPYWINSTTMGVMTVTTTARSLLDDTSTANMRTTLGLAIGTNVQAYNTGLNSIATLSPTTDQMIYTTGSNTYAATGLTSFGRSLIDDANSVVARATLGVVIGTDVQAQNATLASIASTPWSSGIQVLTLTDAATITLKTVGTSTGNILDKASGDTLYQALDATLTALSGLNTTAGLVVQTGTDTFTKRSLAVGSGLSIADATGASGNPTISLDTGLASIAGLTGAGVVTATSTDTFVMRSIGVASSTDIPDRAAADARYLTLSGGTLTGTLTLSADPSSNLDAATKQYVDNVAQGLAVKTSCVAATTTNISLSGAQTIDGVSVIGGDRVLVKNQTAQAENGIYVAASGAWVRASDADSWIEIRNAFTFISGGTINGFTGWTSVSGLTGTLETTAIVFVQFSGSASYSAANGVVLAGTEFGLTGQALALHTLATNGSIHRTGSGTYASRTLTGPAAGITVTNGDGVSGNPTLALANDLAAVEGLATTGFVRRTGTDTWSASAITNSDLPTSGVSASTYRSVTVNAQGIVTGGTNPTTLAGYGIAASDILTSLLTVDGATSTLDADLLDGQEGSYYLAATNLTGTIPAARMPALTGDITTSSGAVATTLATVNSNVGAFGNATHVGAFTVNAKGLTTAASAVLITPAWGSITATPTTLTGYGITDAQPLDAELTALAGLDATAGVVYQTGAGAFSKKTIGTSTGNVLDKAAGDTLYLGISATAANSALLGGQAGSFYQSASNLNAGTVAAARMPALTGDITTSSGAVETTLATVNSNVGAFGNATHVGAFTVNAKGLTTAASAVAITPPWSSITSKPTTLTGYGITDAAPIASPTFTGTVTTPNLIVSSGIINGIGSSASVQLNDGVGASLIYGVARLTVGGPMLFVNNGVERFRVNGDGTTSFSTTSITAGGNTVWHAGNDGVASGLDADLLDGQQGSYYLSASNLNAGTVAAARMPALTGDITTSSGAVATTLATVNSNVGAFGNATHVAAITVNAKGLTTAASTSLITPAWSSITATPTTLVGYGITDAVATSSYTAADVLSKLLTVDGGSSGLDADLLDGQQGSYYQNATNITAGTLASARLPTTTGQLTTFSAGLIVTGHSGAWTSSSYGKGLTMPKGYAAMWPKGAGTYAYGISANVDQLNFLSSTADDNSAAASIMMNANAASSTLTLGLAYFEGGATNGPRILNGGNSTTVPRFSPNKNDAGTGVGSGGIGELALIASSTEAVRITSTATTVNTTLAHNGLVPTAGTEIDQIKTVTDSLTLSTSWQDTTVNATDLATGTYIVQVLIDDDSNGGTQNTEYYSGVMSWYAGDTNSTTSDEVILHRAGISPGANSIFLRVARTLTADANDMKLQITSTNTDSSASNVTFKFRRMI